MGREDSFWLVLRRFHTDSHPPNRFEVPAPLKGFDAPPATPKTDVDDCGMLALLSEVNPLNPNGEGLEPVAKGLKVTTDGWLSPEEVIETGVGLVVEVFGGMH